MQIKLTSGTLDANGNMDGWIITSPSAVADGAEHIELQRGDRINIEGDVWRDDDFIGNINV